MSPKPTIVYWNARGLCQPARSLLAYKGVDFEDKRFQLDANGNGPEWFDQKYNLGLDFPNLPYYVEGNVKLTQSIAILRYLGRKYKLDGSTEEEKIRIDLLEQQVSDLSQAFYAVLFTTGDDADYEKVRENYLNGLSDQLKLLSKFIGSNQFAVGDNISYVDFWLYEYLVKIMHFAPKHFELFPNLGQFVARIESQPKLAQWLKQVGPQPVVGAGLKWNDSH